MSDRGKPSEVIGRIGMSGSIQTRNEQSPELAQAVERVRVAMRREYAEHGLWCDGDAQDCPLTKATDAAIAAALELAAAEAYHACCGEGAAELAAARAACVATATREAL